MDKYVVGRAICPRVGRFRARGGPCCSVGYGRKSSEHDPDGNSAGMSGDANPNEVFTRGPSRGAPSNKNKAGDNIGKAARQQQRPTNHATPEELRRNEMRAADAREKPLPRSVANDKSTQTSESQQVDEADEDDPCLNRSKERTTTSEDEKTGRKFRATPGLDPRFQQQNQTLRCYVMYTDFYRCEKILGEGHEACTWFRDVFTSVCPSEWVERWDGLRAEGRFAWPGKIPIGQSPNDRYGV